MKKMVLAAIVAALVGVGIANSNCCDSCPDDCCEGDTCCQVEGDRCC